MAKGKSKRSSTSKQKKRIPAKKKKKASKKLFERTDQHLWQRDIGLTNLQHRYLRLGALALFLVMALLSIRVGLNGDDDVQANYSSELPSFYTSFGQDTSSFNSGPEIKYYGAVFEILTGLTNAALGFDQTEPRYYKVRHVWNAAFGAATIYFLALFVGEIAGFHAALLAAFLAFFTMRFLGHSFFNPKDIPFAMGYMMSVYYIYRTLKEMPQPSKWTYLGLILGIALCIGVRIGGILVIAYLGLFMGLYFLWKYGFQGLLKRKPTVGKYAKILGLCSLGGIALSLLFWPYGLVNPFRNIPAAFKAFDQFQYAIKVLFDGEMVWSKEIPLNYIVTWIGVTLPIFSLLGLVLFTVFSRGIFRRYNPWAVSLAIFAFAFPIVYVVVKNSVLYDGWRHFLFTYSPALVLVTLGWHYLIEKFSSKRNLQYAVYGLLAISSIDSVLFLVRNSAYPYTYFNPLVAGINGAHGLYELDYWGASVKQAVEWMEKEGILRDDMQDTVIIASNFSHALQVYTNKYDGKVKPVYVRWRQRHDKDWDYSVFVNRFVDGSYLRGGYWPTEKSIHTIKANGVPIAMIEKEDPQKLAFLGSEAIRKKQWQEAITYYQRELEKYPNNELALIGVGMAYLNLNIPQSAKLPLDRAIEITPESQNALNFLGYYHFVTGDYPRANEVFGKAGELHSTNATAFFYLGRIALLSQNYSEAIDHVESCISANGRFKECYQLGVDVYQRMGDQARAKAFQDALNQL